MSAPWGPLVANAGERVDWRALRTRPGSPALLRTATAFILLITASCAHAVTSAPLSTPPNSSRPKAAEAAQRCVTDADCAVSRYASSVEQREDCYCLGCPLPRNAAQATRWSDEWNAHCAGDWERESDCPEPLCARPPGPARCADGTCAWSGDERLSCFPAFSIDFPTEPLSAPFSM